MVPPTKINLPEIKINIASVLPSGAPYEIKIEKKLIYENFQNYGITKSPICLVLLESITFLWFEIQVYFEFHIALQSQCFHFIP